MNKELLTIFICFLLILSCEDKKNPPGSKGIVGLQLDIPGEFELYRLNSYGLFIDNEECCSGLIDWSYTLDGSSDDYVRIIADFEEIPTGRHYISVGLNNDERDMVYSSKNTNKMQINNDQITKVEFSDFYQNYEPTPDYLEDFSNNSIFISFDDKLVISNGTLKLVGDQNGHFAHYYNPSEIRGRFKISADFSSNGNMGEYAFGIAITDFSNTYPMVIVEQWETQISLIRVNDIKVELLDYSLRHGSNPETLEFYLNEFGQCIIYKDGSAVIAYDLGDYNPVVFSIFAYGDAGIIVEIDNFKFFGSGFQSSVSKAPTFPISLDIKALNQTLIQNINLNYKN